MICDMEKGHQKSGDEYTVIDCEVRGSQAVGWGQEKQRSSSWNSQCQYVEEQKGDRLISGVIEQASYDALCPGWCWQDVFPALCFKIKLCCTVPTAASSSNASSAHLNCCE